MLDIRKRVPDPGDLVVIRSGLCKGKVARVVLVSYRGGGRVMTVLEVDVLDGSPGHLRARISLSQVRTLSKDEAQVAEVMTS